MYIYIIYVCINIHVRAHELGHAHFYTHYSHFDLVSFLSFWRIFFLSSLSAMGVCRGIYKNLKIRWFGGCLFFFELSSSSLLFCLYLHSLFFFFWITIHSYLHARLHTCTSTHLHVSLSLSHTHFLSFSLLLSLFSLSLSLFLCVRACDALNRRLPYFLLLFSYTVWQQGRH